MFLLKPILLLAILKWTNSWTSGESREFYPSDIWPHNWIVNLVIDHTDWNRKTTYHCVGSLLHQRAVLTSAMCINRTIPFSIDTDFYVYGEALDDSRQSTREMIFAMANVTYHNFEKAYDEKKFDYCLIILYDRILYDTSNPNDAKSNLISVANLDNVFDIDFNNCILVSITTRQKMKHQVDVQCMLTSTALECKQKHFSSAKFNSGSPVACKWKRKSGHVLIGYISKYNRYMNGTNIEMVSLYTAAVPFGHHLTYNAIDKVMNTFYRVT